MSDTLLTYRDVAKRLNCHVNTVRNMVWSKRLKAVRFSHKNVKFRPADVDRCLNKLEVK